MKVFKFIYQDNRRGRIYSEKIAAPSKVQAVKDFLNEAVINNIVIQEIIRIC
jgi:hypothetical protein